MVVERITSLWSPSGDSQDVAVARGLNEYMVRYNKAKALVSPLLDALNSQCLPELTGTAERPFTYGFNSTQNGLRTVVYLEPKQDKFGSQEGVKLEVKFGLHDRFSLESLTSLNSLLEQQIQVGLYRGMLVSGGVGGILVEAFYD